MEDLNTNTAITNAYSCDGCGAPLAYKPGSSSLVCSHCGSVKNIAQEETIIEELDFNTYMENFEEEVFVTDKIVVCSNCKATPTIDENLKSMACPYCGSPLVETSVQHERYIKPGYVAPFQINRDDINNILAQWAKKLWFAPNNLKKAILSPVNLNGIYMPYWTYDADTQTNYTGQRGDAYYVTVGTGKNQRTVRRVSWHYTSGTISNFYDDVLVRGSRTLDSSIISKMGGWDTKSIVKINDSYLAGFVTEKYQINLRDGFYSAKEFIESSERHNVKIDIGGDEQRIDSMDTQYFNVKFKHVLLPIYASAFRYRDTLYTFYVNGCTGRISGKRPYSKIKIALASIAGLAVILALYYYFSQNG